MVDWAAIVPFLASSYFVFAGAPFSSAPFDRFEGEVRSEIEELAEQKLVRDDRVVFADAIRRQAENAASLSTLPQKAALTALGFVLGFEGWWPYLMALALISVSLGVQRNVDMHRTFDFKVVRLPMAGAAILLLNFIGIVGVIISGTAN